MNWTKIKSENVIFSSMKKIKTFVGFPCLVCHCMHIHFKAQWFTSEQPHTYIANISLTSEQRTHLLHCRVGTFTD